MTTKPIVIIDDSDQERAQLEEQVDRLQENNHRLQVKLDAAELELRSREDNAEDLEKLDAQLSEARALLSAVVIVYGDHLVGIRRFLDTLDEAEEDA